MEEMKGTLMEIYGENVILSRITSHELDFICRIECDRDLWHFEESVESDEQVVRSKYLDRINEGNETTTYDFIVSLVDDKMRTPIGLAQVWSYIDYRKSWELGFAILPDYSGQGYGSEAAKLLLKFAFEQLKAHKVVGMCNSQNTRSAALMEHIGMTKEAVFKEELFWNGKWADQFYYSILEKEFFEGKTV
ncbi:aminoglycoside N(6')-acetyltransferase [Paenibacillus lautus]|uniref:GNAT family N-acetyltransferase n=1 Tax=Paenibacillus lautus TaxID=1401 RepID=UPI001B163E17|nr:GNAT family N-acetyltransferase [Paenibacillus lautus]GIO96047.1 aminoglycoside N(6')-acetyltransferase [Paenibacillus lautus]